MEINPAFYVSHGRLQSSFARLAANYLISVQFPCSSLPLSASAQRLLVRAKTTPSVPKDADMQRHLRKCQQLLIECLFFFCPGGRITCLKMDAFEPHSSRGHLPESARGSRLPNYAPSCPYLHVPASLEWKSGELCAFLTSEKMRDDDEATVSSRLLLCRLPKPTSPTTVNECEVDHNVEVSLFSTSLSTL